MELDLPTPVSRPPSLGSSGEIDHQGGASTTLPPPWVFTHLNHGGQGGALGGESLEPDSREGGRDTGVGRYSSISPNSRIQYKDPRSHQRWLLKEKAQAKAKRRLENYPKLWTLISPKLEGLEQFWRQIWKAHWSHNEGHIRDKT